MTKQSRMFGHEDLPLFSGTPVRVEPEESVSYTDRLQRALAVDCLVCRDTGIVLVEGEPRFCWCPIGLQVWDQAKRDGEA